MSFYGHGKYPAQVRDVESTHSWTEGLRQRHKHYSYLMLQSGICICPVNESKPPNGLMETTLPQGLNTSPQTTLSYCFTEYLDWDKSSLITHNPHTL